MVSVKSVPIQSVIAPSIIFTSKIWKETTADIIKRYGNKLNRFLKRLKFLFSLGIKKKIPIMKSIRLINPNTSIHWSINSNTLCYIVISLSVVYIGPLGVNSLFLSLMDSIFNFPNSTSLYFSIICCNFSLFLADFTLAIVR